MSLISVIKNIFGFGSTALKAGDRMLVCIDCSDQFVFDLGEQKFFKSKGFTDPKRCPNCRKKVKSQFRRKQRPQRRNNRHFGRHDSIIDGDSPYVDER